MSKRGKGKRRAYTMSPAARAQRRGAAWKHGGRAASPLSQVLHPCKKCLCPMTDADEKGNCGIKRQAEAAGQAVEHCVVPLAINPEIRDRYVAAVKSGDFEGLAEFIGGLLGGMGHLAHQELGETIREGLAVSFEIFGPDRQSATGVKVNPRAEPLLKLLDMLGATAAQQALTPKSRGERERDEGIGGMLEIYKRRSALAGARSEG